MNIKLILGILLAVLIIGLIGGAIYVGSKYMKKRNLENPISNYKKFLDDVEEFTIQQERDPWHGWDVVVVDGKERADVILDDVSENGAYGPAALDYLQQNASLVKSNVDWARNLVPGQNGVTAAVVDEWNLFIARVDSETAKIEDLEAD
jgi:hypothetical protein